MEYGPVLAEGKTKIVYAIPDERYPEWSVALRAKDTVTWLNKFSAPMPGKGAWSTRTTVAMFEILKMTEHPRCPTAYLSQLDETTIQELNTRMIPLEVVVRDVVDEKSSFLKRHPDAKPGMRFREPHIEFFLKSHGKEFGGIALPDDDPYVSKISNTGIWVHHPGKPIEGEGVFIPAEVFNTKDGLPIKMLFVVLESFASSSFFILREAWKRIDFDLRDFKLEFGYTWRGTICLADVIDNDSMRIRDAEGNERSKQNVRDGKSILEAAKDYAFIADKSEELLALLRRTP